MTNDTPSGLVTAHNLISAIGDLSLRDFDDLTDCTYLATRSADLVHNRFANSRPWLDEYVRTLLFLGWTLRDDVITTRTRFDVSGSVADFLVRRAQTMPDVRQGNAMIDTLDALKPDGLAVRSLDEESLKGRRFQVVAARYDARGELHIALFNLELEVHIEKNDFLFWHWEDSSAKIVQQSAFLKLNRDVIDTRRTLMAPKLRENLTKRFALRKRRP